MVGQPASVHGAQHHTARAANDQVCLSTARQDHASSSFVHPRTRGAQRRASTMQFVDLQSQAWSAICYVLFVWIYCGSSR